MRHSGRDGAASSQVRGRRFRPRERLTKACMGGVRVPVSSILAYPVSGMNAHPRYDGTGLG